MDGLIRKNKKTELDKAVLCRLVPSWCFQNDVYQQSLNNNSNSCLRMLWFEEHKEQLVLWITPLIKSFRSVAPNLIGSQRFLDYQSFAAPPTKSFSTTEEVKSHHCFITFNIFSCSSVSAVGENFMYNFVSERYEGKTTTKTKQ